MSTWDSEDFEPSAAKTAKVNRWEKEDEGKTKDNWDENDEDSEEESEEEPVVAIQVKEKKSGKEMLTEEKAVEENIAKQAEAAAPTAGDKSAQPSKDAAKPDVTLAEAVGPIDQFEATNKEQFDKFGELLKEKITKYEVSSFYATFLESLLRDASANLEADDVKKILNTVNAISNEKVKQQKAAKGKKKPKKATLVVGKDAVKDEIGGDADYDEFDDYV